MSMTKADILYDCLSMEMVDPKQMSWLTELYELSDPQADKIRSLEKEIESLCSALAEGNTFQEKLVSDFNKVLAEASRAWVLAAKHCPLNHSDWQEITKAAEQFSTIKI